MQIAGMLASTIIVVFCTIAVESVFLILQLRGKLLTRLLGKNAFALHAIVTCMLWALSFIFICLLQKHNHPSFHESDIFSYAGLAVCAGGLVLSIWALKILGISRALCANFYYDGIPTVNASIYKYLKNPMDLGFWAALLGCAVFTRSIYNLIIAFEFIALMIPHSVLENIPLKEVQHERVQ
jgi:protein-S-isoprenylcysteine O-methyltransferase Ste14